jgi:2-keto-4-pentenoate hydratase/2-oxohepta-3-ene-1,7-dioic acid hydratase in catechol pathway
MKFARFKTTIDGMARCAVLEEGKLHEIKGDIFGEWRKTGTVHNVSEVQLLAPFTPNSIIGVGKNYVAAHEVKPDKHPEIPVFFYKPVSSIIGPDDDIVIPSSLKQIKFEAELAVVIGKRARQISEQEALEYVFGYTVANDVTAPQFFHADGHWMVGKSFDTFTPMGPFLETELNLTKVNVQALHNGQLKQDSPLDLMILSIPFLLSYLSSVMTLQPGDVLLSGAPVGADFMSSGDSIECQIEGIGVLRNAVVASRA